MYRWQAVLCLHCRRVHWQLLLLWQVLHRHARSSHFQMHGTHAIMHLLRIRRALALCKSSITALILSAALTSAVSRYLGSAMLSGNMCFLITSRSISFNSNCFCALESASRAWVKPCSGRMLAGSFQLYMKKSCSSAPRTMLLLSTRTRHLSASRSAM